MTDSLPDAARLGIFVHLQVAAADQAAVVEGLERLFQTTDLRPHLLSARMVLAQGDGGIFLEEYWGLDEAAFLQARTADRALEPFLRETEPLIKGRQVFLFAPAASHRLV